jgi:hypothetical protein
MCDYINRFSDGSYVIEDVHGKYAYIKDGKILGIGHNPQESIVCALENAGKEPHERKVQW